MDEKKNIKESPEGESKAKAVRKTTAASKRGIYTAAISALVIAIVIVFNLVVGGLPAGTLEYDISGNKTYTVSEQSVNYLKTLDKDISIVVLAQESVIDEQLLRFINNYAKLSSHITLKIIDPVLNPTALETYGAKENNVVVSCTATNKTKILNLAGMSGYQDGLILYDPTYYQYYNQLHAVSLDAEGLLTSAVSNVTSATLNKIYMLSGHSEAELGTNATAYLSKANVETASLNLLTDGSIPDDCNLIMIDNPQKDLNDDELNMLSSYLRNGGKVLLFLDNPALTNFNALLAIYGLQMQDGYVADNERYYKAYAEQYGYFCIYPVLSTGSDVTANITADANIIGARGMLQVTPQRTNAVVTPFMTTSQSGVLVVDENNSIEGQYILGATVTETFTDNPDVETRLTVISAVDLLSDFSTSENYSNMDIFLNAVNSNFSEVTSFVIPSKSLELEPTSLGQGALWGSVLVGIIPFILLGGGIVYWTKRRNR